MPELQLSYRKQQSILSILAGLSAFTWQIMIRHRGSAWASHPTIQIGFGLDQSS